MSISIFSPPPIPRDESGRRDAVLASGLLAHRGSPVIAQIVRSAALLARTRMAAATLILDDRQIVLCGYRMAEGASRRATSVCAHAILVAPHAFYVPDMLADHRFAENPAVAEWPFLRFYLGVPLTAPGGHALGELCVLDDRPHAHVPTSVVAGLATLAAQVTAVPTMMRGIAAA